MKQKCWKTGILYMFQRVKEVIGRQNKIRSDEALTLETSALEFLHGGQITLATLLINQTFVSTPHRRSATVSLETGPVTRPRDFLGLVRVKNYWGTERKLNLTVSVCSSHVPDLKFPKI